MLQTQTASTQHNTNQQLIALPPSFLSYKAKNTFAHTTFQFSLTSEKKKTMTGFSRSSSASSLFLLFLLFGFSVAAKELLVGGKIDAWKIPSSEADSLSKWAERSRFQVGDHLVWKYDGGKDSVLEVDREDYVNCSTSNPIKEYSDGNTKLELDRPGPFYFISGAKGHCEKGQKVIVVVMTPRHGGRYTGISPAPSPAAVAPSSDATTLKNGLVMALVFAVYVGGFLM